MSIVVEFFFNKSIKSKTSENNSEFSSSSPGSKLKINGLDTIRKLLGEMLANKYSLYNFNNCGLIWSEQNDNTGSKPGIHIDSSSFNAFEVRARKMSSYKLNAFWCTPFGNLEDKQSDNLFAT